MDSNKGKQIASKDVIQDIQESERAEILNQYRGMMRHCMDFSRAERKEIRKAFEYSLNAHGNARRKSGEPYIIHPISVAKIVVKEMGLDAVSVVAALLHDVVEDTFAELKDIERDFGVEVELIIDGLTKISGVFDPGSSAQAENFRKMLLTLSDDIRVILIKIADRLHNMRTLQYMKKESQLKIASETHYLYTPLANRLGLHEIKSELEDLSLKYTEPQIYIELNSKLIKTQRESRYYIQTFIKAIREKLHSGGLDFEIKHRFKSVSSIYSKMKRQGVPFEEVYDLFAIRIILNSAPANEKTDCWKVYSLITDLYKPNPERLRDWITVPKSNGYEALHVTVMGPRGKWIEVQVRTNKMDENAEKGIAAHWRYKETDPNYDGNIERLVAHVRDLLENPNMNAVDAIREFKSHLVTEEVYVFTPRGELLKLPVHSSVIDFAFEIHSKIGESCIGAKVNNKVVPLSYNLQNGDQVEIITSKKQKPQQEWLRYAKTSKAAHKIKDSLKLQRKKLSQDGRQLYEWTLERIGLTESEALIKEALSFFRIGSINEFYYLIGSHHLDKEKLLEFIDLKKRGQPIDVSELSPSVRERMHDKQVFEALVKEKTGKTLDELVVGEDIDLTQYKLALCCNPVKGDDILGFFMPGEGILIHRTNCPKAIGLMSNFGGNIMRSKWTEKQDITFLAEIRIKGEDRQGMMNDLLKVISIRMGLNIRSITIDSIDGMFEGLFRVFIHDTHELNRLVLALKKVTGVMQVSRAEYHES